MIKTIDTDGLLKAIEKALKKKFGKKCRFIGRVEYPCDFIGTFKIKKKMNSITITMERITNKQRRKK
jgi:hypothetical protein